MALYTVSDLTTASNSVEGAMALLELAVESIDNAKTIRYIDIIELIDQKKYIGVVIHDA